MQHSLFSVCFSISTCWSQPPPDNLPSILALDSRKQATKYYFSSRGALLYHTFSPIKNVFFTFNYRFESWNKKTFSSISHLSISQHYIWPLQSSPHLVRWLTAVSPRGGCLSLTINFIIISCKPVCFCCSFAGVRWPIQWYKQTSKTWRGHIAWKATMGLWTQHCVTRQDCGPHFLMSTLMFTLACM